MVINQTPSILSFIQDLIKEVLQQTLNMISPALQIKL